MSFVKMSAGRSRNSWVDKKDDFKYNKSIQEHNQRTLDSLQEGDLVKFQRGCHRHWGVYIGRDKVIHLVGWDAKRSARASTACFMSDSKDQTAKIVEEYFQDVAGHGKAFKANERDNKDIWRPKSPYVIVQRAKQKLSRQFSGEMFLDCEKFAIWCRYDMGSGPHFHNNSDVLHSLQMGDLVSFRHALYEHWAVYIGDEQVIHLVGVDEQGQAQNTSFVGILKLRGTSKIVQDNFWKEAKDNKATMANLRNENGRFRPLPPLEIVARAKGKLGPVPFDFLKYNCEHFAMWCRYNEELSTQVLGAAVGTVAVATAAAVTFPFTFGALAVGAAATYFFSKKDDDSEKR